jgi:hypothetical protein
MAQVNQLEKEQPTGRQQRLHMLEHGRDALGMLMGVLMRFARRYLMAYASTNQKG